MISLDSISESYLFYFCLFMDTLPDRSTHNAEPTVIYIHQRQLLKDDRLLFVYALKTLAYIFISLCILTLKLFTYAM